MSDLQIYSEKDQRRIDNLNDQLERLKEEFHKKEKLIEREIDKIVVLQCPIQPGNIVEFEYGKDRIRRGRVKSIRTDWNGTFTLRVHILTKDGREVGWANVGADRCPTLISKK